MIFGTSSKKDIVGIDIGDRSIEALWLEGKPTSPKLVGHSRIEVDGHIIENGSIVDPEELKETIKETLQTAKPEPISANKALITIPDLIIENHLIEVKTKKTKLPVNELVEVAQDTFKSKLRNCYISYYLVSEDKTEGSQFYFVAAVERPELDAYLNVLKDIGIAVVGVDFEPLSAARTIVPENLMKEWALLDVGANKTTFTVFVGRRIYSSHSIPVGGDEFTSSVSEAMEISGIKADQLKKEKGLKDTEVLKAISSNLDEIASKTVQYVKETEKKYQVKISEIVLGGGSSLMPGWQEYWSDKLSQEATTSLIDPYIQLEGFGDVPLYINSVGLAIRALSKNPESGFNFIAKEFSTKKEKKPKPEKKIIPTPKVEPLPVAAPSKPASAQKSEISFDINPQKQPEKIQEKPLPPARPAKPIKSKETVVEMGDKDSANAAKRKTKLLLVLITLCLAALPIAWLISQSTPLEEQQPQEESQPEEEGEVTEPEQTGEQNTAGPRDTIQATAELVIASDSENGMVAMQEVNREIEITPEGESEVEDYATGTATVYNKTSQDQSIVGGSRLETESEQVFRTQAKIVIPQGGSRDVEIKADDKGEVGNIEPQKLTFVTLPHLSDTLYAETSESLTGGLTTASSLTQDAIDQAVQEDKARLIDSFSQLDWSDKIDSEIYDLITPPVTIELVSTECDAAVGDIVDSATCELTYEAYTAAVSKKWNNKKKQTVLSGSLEEGEKADDYSFESQQVSIQKYDTSALTATLEISYTFTSDSSDSNGE